MKDNNRKINDMRDIQNELGRTVTKKGLNKEMLEAMPVVPKQEELDRSLQTPVRKRASSKITPVKSAGASAKTKSPRPTLRRAMTTPISGQSASGTQPSTGKRKMMGLHIDEEDDEVDYPATPSKRPRNGRKTVPGYRAARNLQSSRSAFDGNENGFPKSHSMSSIQSGGMNIAQSPINSRVMELCSPGLLDYTKTGQPYNGPY
jgi:hypothetical protein